MMPDKEVVLSECFAKISLSDTEEDAWKTAMDEYAKRVAIDFYKWRNRFYFTYPDLSKQPYTIEEYFELYLKSNSK